MVAGNIDKARELGRLSFVLVNVMLFKLDFDVRFVVVRIKDFLFGRVDRLV